MKRQVYNLAFRSWYLEMTVFGYRFEGVAEYKERLRSLQHLVTVYSEFEVRANTGTHAVTACVEIPDPEEEAVLYETGTALDDILLLISIFTGRHVFALDSSNGEDDNPVLIADSRIYPWGGLLGCSIPYKADSTRDPLQPCNVGLEQGLNDIYKRVRREEWQRKYEHGHFLSLVNHALRQQDLAAAFTQCWTIWEHLFTVLNRTWMSDDQIRKRTPASEKIAYLLAQFVLKNTIEKSLRKGIKSLVETRNRLVHYGGFPEHGPVHEDAVLFIRLTEFITAKILGLCPSEVFNTMDKFEEFWKRQSAKGKQP